jgi:hypothetical protein
MVKEAMIAESDETFAISPLGKCFINDGAQPVDKKQSQINKALNSLYQRVRVPRRRENVIKCITTRRTSPEQLLFNHSNNMKQCWGTPRELILKSEIVVLFSNSDAASVPHLYLEFKLHEKKTAQIPIEFPHEQNRMFRKEMFSCDI